jgi:hypothetical protein
MITRRAKVKKPKYRKVRAIELFAAGTPFKSKRIDSKKTYRRKSRSNRNEE